AIQSRPARMPASGPGKPATLSATTGRPNEAKRAGSPLALRINPSHCGASRAITRSRRGRPRICRIGLSPPPPRRARPAASSTPGILATLLVVTAFALAPMACGFFLDIVEALVVDEALGARQRDEALATGAADQRQSDLQRQVDAPGREARSRH